MVYGHGCVGLPKLIWFVSAYRPDAHDDGKANRVKARMLIRIHANSDGLFWDVQTQVCVILDLSLCRPGGEHGCAVSAVCVALRESMMASPGCFPLRDSRHRLRLGS